MTRPIVLIHGAWHNSAHWDDLLAELALRGRQTRAIDLPGHGAEVAAAALHGPGARNPAVADVTLRDAAEAINRALATLGAGPKPIVVAHSIGGAPLTLAAELAPELYGRLAYLAAFVPAGRGSSGAYMALPEFNTGYGADLFVGDPTTLGSVRINPKGDRDYLERLHATYYQDVGFDRFMGFAAKLTPDLPLSFVADEVAISPSRWGRIPRSYVLCTNDRALSPVVQRMMVREADALVPVNPFEVLELASGHSPFASMPGALAALLDQLT